MTETFDALVVGAGPTGLACAIELQSRGVKTVIVEKGCVVNSIYHYPTHMTFFTTPELLEIGGLPFVSPYEKPTRAEALGYYRKVVAKYDLRISYEETVLSVVREDDVFALETRTSRGVRRARHAHNVLMAIGYYDHANLIGVPGEDLPQVHHYYSEPHAFFGKRVVIVGGGNSAAEAALECYRAGAQVTLVHRWAQLKESIKYWVKPDIENRIKEGSIAARVNTCVTEIRPTSVVVRTAGAKQDEELPADEVLLMTGYRSDSALLRAAGIRLNERDEPTYDAETFETNVPGLFVAGGAVTGQDTSNIFIENGRFHGEKIVQVIADRLRA
jgi:thioredoxin reductase (NADPH)